MGNNIVNGVETLTAESFASHAGVFVAASDASEKEKSRADFICDGVTDAATIQAAFLQTNTVVRLSTGTFLLEQTIEMRGAGLIGASNIATVLQWSPVAAGIMLDIIEGGSTIRDIRFIGNFEATYGIDFDSAGTTSPDTVLIDNCVFLDLAGGGAAIRTGSSNTYQSSKIINCQFVDCLGGGIEVFSASKWTITGNRITISGGETLLGSAISCQNSTYVTIANNVIEIDGDTTNFSYGIRFGDSSYCTAIGNILQPSQTNGLDAGIIWTKSSGHVGNLAGVVISNNIINGFTSTAVNTPIFVFSESGASGQIVGGVISGNTVSNNSKAEAIDGVINGATARDFTIYGNTTDGTIDTSWCTTPGTAANRAW
jgi:hypothetical protein